MAIPVAPQPVQQPKSWGEYLKKLKNNTCSDGCCSLRVEQATIDKKFNSVYYIAQCNKRCQILYLCHLFHVLNSLCFYSAFKTLRPIMRAFWWMCVYSRNLCKLTKPTKFNINSCCYFVLKNYISVSPTRCHPQHLSKQFSLLCLTLKHFPFLWFYSFNFFFTTETMPIVFRHLWSQIHS